MTNALEHFFSKPFSNYFMENLHDDDPDSLFVICWEPQHFAKIREFLKFTKRFASIMQFLGGDYSNEELADYFSEPPQLDWETEYDFNQFPPTTRDIKSILDELFPEVEIPWLGTGQYTKTISIPIEDDYNYVSQGPSGFIHAFVADDVDFDYE